MAVEWYCKVMGSEVGPLTQDQLVDMVRNHRVNPEDLVRRKGSLVNSLRLLRQLSEYEVAPKAKILSLPLKLSTNRRL